MTETPTRTSDWIRRFRPAPEAAVRLICLPHAGGAATFYLPVAQAMAPDVDVLAVQYPGRQDRRHEPCVDDITVLADLITDELLPWTDQPLALFGHSMGALVAFEVACRLEERGRAPVALFASGRRAPSRRRDERFHLASDDELVAEIRRLSGTEQQVLEDEEILHMILPAIRSDYRAVEMYRYRPRPALNCPVIALTGDDDPRVTLEEAGDWAGHTQASFRLRVFPGGHFYLNTHATAVMAEITRSIEEYGHRG